MTVVLLGGPQDGLVVALVGDRLVFPVAGRLSAFLVGEGDSATLDLAPMRLAVYGGPLLRHPDRRPDMRALCFLGYEQR